MGRAGAPPPPSRACAFDGCEVIVKNQLGFCVAHHNIAWPCSFDASCRYRCAAHSKWRICQEHSWWAKKLDRMERAKRFRSEE